MPTTSGRASGSASHTERRPFVPWRGAPPERSPRSRRSPARRRSPRGSAYCRRAGRRCAPRSLPALDAFIGEIQELDEYLVALGVEIARVVFRWPCLPHAKERLRLAAFVEDDDAHIATRICDVACQHLRVPVEQIHRRRHAALQRDVAVFLQAGQLAHSGGFITLAILDDLGRCGADCHLAEADVREAVDLHAEAEVFERILPCHDALSAVALPTIAPVR